MDSLITSDEPRPEDNEIQKQNSVVEYDSKPGSSLAPRGLGPDIDTKFSIGSMIQKGEAGREEYGVIRWLGYLKANSDEIMAGVEMVCIIFNYFRVYNTG